MYLARLITVTLILSLGPWNNNLMAKEKDMGVFSIKENILMLYYKDIATVAPFYEDVLGLKKTFDQGWAKIYQLTPASFVGVIQESEGSFHKVQANNAVMLSIVTDQVDAWYERLKSNSEVTFLKEIYNNKHAPIRAFLIEDPGGYSIEFFQWLELKK